MNYDEFESRFVSEEDCLNYLFKIRWPNGYCCPRCGCKENWKIQPYKYKCRSCNYQTTVISGTMFQHSHVCMKQWFQAIWYMSEMGRKAKAVDLQEQLKLGSSRTAQIIVENIQGELFTTDIISRGCGKGISMSKDEIAETALKQAEQNYGYKLTLDSCEVVDTSSSKRKWPLTGEKVKVNVYGVLLKADANDSAGNTVESLKYEVLIQQWDYDNNISAQAVDCTDLDDKDIVQKIKEDVKNAE